MGHGTNGNPAYALLDVLEGEQRRNFTDENIELPFDLSTIPFICTANKLKDIPKVLRDRLEIIHISGYTAQAKQNIAKFTIKRMMQDLKINDSQLEFTDGAVQKIVEHTDDQGARKTIENINCIIEHVIKLIEESSGKPVEKIVINESEVEEMLRNKQALEENA